MAMKKMKISWAIQTKHPGDSQDYRVLACSKGNMNADTYDFLIRKWMTGEVPLDNTSYNPAAPWYQFGIEEEGEQIVLIKQIWAGYGDFTNRPVLESICLLIPFEKLAEAGCGFKQMMDIFEQEEVSNFLKERKDSIYEGNENLTDKDMQIVLPTQNEVLIWMENAVEEVGQETCLQGLDMLLKGHLRIVPGGTDIPGVNERVKWLDAILALLPYGVRANCPASLWVSGNMSNNINLYWGLPSSEGSQLVQDDITSDQIDYIEDTKKIEFLLGKGMLDRVIESLIKKTKRTDLEIGICDEIFNELGNTNFYLEQIQNGNINIHTESEKIHEAFRSPNFTFLENQEKQEYIIEGILPTLSILDLPHILSVWNEEYYEILAEQVIQSFFGQNQGNFETLCASMQLLLLVGKINTISESLLERLKNSSDDEYDGKQRLLIRVIQKIASVGLIENDLWLDSVIKNVEINNLINFIRKLVLMEDDFYYWASLIDNQDEASIFQKILEDSTELSKPIKALKLIWDKEAKQPIKLIEKYEINNIDQIAILIQSALLMNKLDWVFQSGTDRILTSLNNGINENYEEINNLIRFLETKKEILSREDSKIVETLRETLHTCKYDLITIDPNDEIILSPYNNIIIKMISELQDIEQKKYLYKIIKRLILDIKQSSEGNENNEASLIPQTREIRNICKDYISTIPFENNETIADTYFYVLSDIFHRWQYPKTASELWKLLNYIKNYLIEKEQEKISHKIEYTFLNAVLLQQKILSVSEREKFIKYYSEHSLNNLDHSILIFNEIIKNIDRSTEEQNFLDNFTNRIASLFPSSDK